VIVVRSGKTTRKGLQRTLKRLKQVGSTVVGVVMNDVEAGRDGYRYYYQRAGDESTRRESRPDGSNGKSPDGRPASTALAREDQR
jgi:Mrp family chromosome partitioning ATPase